MHPYRGNFTLKEKTENARKAIRRKPTIKQKYQNKSIKSKVPKQKYQIKSTKSKVPKQKYQIKSTKTKVPKQKYQIKSTKTKVPKQNTKTKYQKKEVTQMAQKDVEIRRMSLLKHQLSPVSILNLSLEVLKTQTDPITVEKLYVTAGRIVAELPDLKKALDALSLEYAKEAELWVMGTDQAEAPQAETPKAEMPKAETPVVPVSVDPPLAEAPKAEPPKAEMPKAEVPKAEVPKAEAPKAEPPAEDFPSEAPAPVEKTDDVIVGEIKAVSKTGKGIKIDDLWYNITSKTEKSVEPERGKVVRVKFFRGNTGLVVVSLKAAAA